MNKEEWINEVMGSARGMQPAAANPYLHTRIRARLEAPLPKMPLRWALAVSVPVVALLLLNILLWQRPAKQQPETSPGMEQVIRAYSISDSDLYSATEKELPNEQD